MGKNPTVAEALREAAGRIAPSSESARLDAEVLLSHSMDRSRAWVLAHPEAELSNPERAGFRAALERAEAGEALPYVLGWWEFYGRRFRVTPDVLIPRPETELLVGAALAMLRGEGGFRTVADVGTGSGCVAVTLALEAPGLRVVATDRFAPALHLARSNACALGAERKLDLLQADLLTPFGAVFDLVCANLPYVPTRELRRLPVSKREPWHALDGGQDGMTLIRELLSSLPRVLAPGGAALLEIGAGQGAEAVRAAREALPEAAVEVKRDLTGRERLLTLRWR